METIDRVVEGMSVGIPVSILRMAHPNVIIRDEGHSFKLTLVDSKHVVVKSREILKGSMKAARIITLQTEIMDRRKR